MGLRFYRVKRNDTLPSISQQFYGSQLFANVIYQANRHYILDPNAVYPGQRLIIPYVAEGSKVEPVTT